MMIKQILLATPGPCRNTAVAPLTIVVSGPTGVGGPSGLVGSAHRGCASAHRGCAASVNIRAQTRAAAVPRSGAILERTNVRVGTWG